jgi:wyosine [tRNA(Phe)-imidazoG37] synthetase (radical SAM superfamily)
LNDIPEPGQPPAGGYRYLFGPVLSRRLGRSLGVDLVPLKTCSFNCRFCQVGPTAETTMERREYAPVEAVLGEFEDWLKRDGSADFVTLSGSGEPTLHSRFGEVIQGVKTGGKPVALLTNSSLMPVEAVRSDAAHADLVKVSLSAWDQESFEAINRPHPGCSLETVVEGLRAFRAVFRGKLWLEVFVLAGINDNTGAAARIAGLARTFAPDRIHLNTVARPPAETSARAAGAAVLQKMTRQFDPPAEVIAGFPGAEHQGVEADEERVMALAARRPCTAADVADGLGIHRMTAIKILENLARSGRIDSTRRGGRVYYRISGGENRNR